MANLKTDYSISLSTNIDTSKVQKALNQKKYIVNVDIDTKTAEDRVNRFFTKANSDFQRINTSIQTGLTGTTEKGTQLKGLIKYVETFKNALGDVQERITVMSKNGRVYSSVMQDVSNGISNVTTEVSKSSEIYKGYSASVSQVAKTVTDTKGNIQQVIETTRQWTDANGKLNTEIQTTDANGNQLAPTITKIQKAEQNAVSTTDNLVSANKKLGQSFTDVIGKVAKFYLASLPIRAVQTAITETVETVKEFDKAFTEMSKVATSSGTVLEEYARQLGELGQEVGRTTTEMVEGATGWIKAGYSEEDAQILTKFSALLQNTADEELSASEATSILVSQLKAYHMDASQAIEVTDVLNAVSAQQAVSSGDLAKGLTQASASMATFGNDLYETTALLAAGTTINLEKLL